VEIPNLSLRYSDRRDTDSLPLILTDLPVVEDGWMVRLQTARLVLRRWQEDDIAPMAAINADPAVMRWIGRGTVWDPARTAAAIAATERSWDEHGFGLFAVEMRSTGRVAGFAGLATPSFLPEILPAVEMGWRLGRQHWGQGLATEAARAVMHFGFVGQRLERIVSIHQVGNDASERIILKLGMRLDRETTDPSCGRLVRVHVITRAEYECR
jgi:RimJ/RimL family protein N-acetyltransferase